jgi:hypothetical protein
MLCNLNVADCVGIISLNPISNMQPQSLTAPALEASILSWNSGPLTPVLIPLHEICGAALIRRTITVTILRSWFTSAFQGNHILPKVALGSP